MTTPPPHDSTGPAAAEMSAAATAAVQALLERLYLGLLVVDSELRVVVWNRFLELHSSRPSTDVLGKVIFDCFPELPRPWLERRLRTIFRLRNSAFTSWRERPFLFRFSQSGLLGDGDEPMRQDCGFFPILDDAGRVTHVAISVSDSTDTYRSHSKLEQALGQLQESHRQIAAEVERRDRAENELRRIHRLEAVGQLAAGVAHEINSPLQFMTDNAYFLETAINDLMQGATDLLALGEQPLHASGDAESRARAREIGERLDLAYLRGAAPTACGSLNGGIGRISEIVSALKDFARPDGDSLDQLDLNRALEQVVMLAKAKFSSMADIELDPGPSAVVECGAGAINQALLELVVNAAEAIARKRGETGPRGLIRVGTELLSNGVAVIVQDTGCGIPAALSTKIFDPFFTTKPVGAGRGHGLAMVQTVVAQHAGRVTFTSEVDQGTTFRIELPARRQRLPAVEAATVVSGPCSTRS
jgi:two-component system NtrC family sensor kinase